MPASALPAVAGLPGVIHVGRASPGLVPEDEISDQIEAGNVDPTTNRPVPGYGAWLEERGLDGGGVRVAVVDTGIQPAHPDLVSHAEKSVDYMTPAQPGDAVGHGTHVAGIIGGAPPAGILPADLDGCVYGVGVAPAATLLGLNGIGLASVFSSTEMVPVVTSAPDGSRIYVAGITQLLGGTTEGSYPTTIALDPEDGAVLWDARYGPPTTPNTTNPTWPSITAAGGRVFVGVDTREQGRWRQVCRGTATSWCSRTRAELS